MIVNFNEISDKEFIDILDQYTEITKYFYKKTIKQWKKFLAQDYPNGIELEYFIANCPNAKEYHELYAYLGGK